MDIGRLRQDQLIAAIGGLVLIISLFLSWSEVDLGGSASAFDAFSGMDIILLLIGIAALGLAVVTAVEARVTLPARADLILALLGIFAVGWTLGWVLEDPSAGIGAWLGLLATLAIAFGGLQGARILPPADGTPGATRRRASGRVGATTPAGTTTTPGGLGGQPDPAGGRGPIAEPGGGRSPEDPGTRPPRVV